MQIFKSLFTFISKDNQLIREETDQTTNSNAYFNSESCDVVLNISQQIYLDEIERFKQVEQKSTTYLAFIGIIIGFIITTITLEKHSPNTTFTICMFIFNALIFLLFFISIFFILLSLNTKDYRQLDINDIVNEELAKDYPANVRISLAATYKVVILENQKLIDKKMKHYQTALILSMVGLFLFTLQVILQEVIEYV